FKAFCGFDSEVLNAPEGVTMEFMVFTNDPYVFPEVSVPVTLSELGFSGKCTIRDIWNKNDVGVFSNSDFAPIINSHGAGLYRISALNRSSQVQCTIETSSTLIQPGDSLELTISVSKTATDLPNPDGSIFIYQNDSLIFTSKLDSTNQISIKPSLLVKGEYLFRALYGGNTFYIPVESSIVEIIVKDTSSSNFEKPSFNQIWVSTENGINYLKGVQTGDSIALFNVKGELTNKIKAASDVVVISGEGVTIIRVTRDKNGFT
ncbi:MAG: hypothetical protein M0P66_16860, partial [Salinivirgaceae bacterium]|nr:hypothetical protein [Salinivirgaceae bacterium]